MKEKLIKIVVVMTIVLGEFTMAHAQNTFNTHVAMSNSELRQLFDERPWLLGVYQESKGQDIDLTTIAVDSTIFWKIRPFTGWRLSFAAGASADFSLGDNPEKMYGGVAEIKFGYAMRRGGIDVGVGLSTIGTQKGREFGLYNLSVNPYLTPFRGGVDDQNRFDVGVVIGVQQATAAVYDSYKADDGMVWGDSGRKTTMPRAMVGGFLRYERRQFMGPNRFAIEASVTTYRAKATMSQYAENITTGEVLIDRNESVNIPHIQVQLKLCWAFGLGKTARNY